MTGEPAGSLVDLLARAAQCRRGDDDGIRCLDRRGGESWRSWSQLWQAACRRSARMRCLGVGRGDRVALVLSTGHELIELFFSVLLARGVPALLPPPSPLTRRAGFASRTRRLIVALEPRLVVAEPGLCSALEEAGVRYCPPAQLSGHTGGEPSAAPEGQDLGLIQFSSGTTDDPRPVALTHRALLAQIRSLNALWPDQPGLRHSGVSWLPLHHDMGLVGCLLLALERAATLTLLPPELFAARPLEWLRAIGRYRASISPAPSFAYRACVEAARRGGLDGLDLSSWKVALCGAEAISAGALRDFVDCFSPWGLRPEALTPAYGLAEATLAVTLAPLGEPFSSRSYDRDALARGRAVERPGGAELVSVGSPLPEFDVEVRDEAGRPRHEAEIGRVWVRGPSLMSGYLGQPRATREVFRDGWLDTGDLGFWYRRELVICGREKDLVVVHGRNHSPEPIEEVVGAVPGLRRGSVVAVSWLEEGTAQESLWVLAERGPGGQADDPGLAEEGRRRLLAELGLSSEVVVLEPRTLPRTTSGKLRRQEALRRFRSGTLGAAPRAQGSGHHDDPSRTEGRV